MAKAPRPGMVKTRLTPPLTPDLAMALSAAFLRDVTENVALAARSAPIAGYVAYAPAGLEHLFDGRLAEGTGLVLADGTDGDAPGVIGFGQCLLHAARGLFALGYGSVCLLNSDSPTLPTEYLVRAAMAQRPGRIVLGAAEDGGYYLIGMSAPVATVFADIAWSSEHVAEQTRERVAAAGLELLELPVWYDVDDAAALRRLVGELASPGGHYAAPVTAAALPSAITECASALPACVKAEPREAARSQARALTQADRAERAL
jgi:rSAM/selenodomain-associated transferase 1